MIGVTKETFYGLGESPRDCWIPLTMTAQLETGPDLFGPKEPERLRRFSAGQGGARAPAKPMSLFWVGRNR